MVQSHKSLNYKGSTHRRFKKNIDKLLSFCDDIELAFQLWRWVASKFSVIKHSHNFHFRMHLRNIFLANPQILESLIQKSRNNLKKWSVGYIWPSHCMLCAMQIPVYQLCNRHFCISFNSRTIHEMYWYQWNFMGRICRDSSVCLPNFRKIHAKIGRNVSDTNTLLAIMHFSVLYITLFWIHKILKWLT